MGAKRFELYEDGRLTEKDLFAPNLSYRAQASDLFEVAKKEDEANLIELEAKRKLEDLRKDGKEYRDKEHKGIREGFLTRKEIFDNLESATETDKMLVGFEEQRKIREAEQFIRHTFGIIANYRDIPLDVANDMNQELVRAFNMFGTVGIIENIKSDRDLLDRGAFANYNGETKTISLRLERGRFSATYYIKNAPEGKFSTKSPLHGYRHEIGHAILKYCEESRDRHERLRLVDELEKIRNKMFFLSNEGYKQLSEYAGNNIREMVAEAIAQAMHGEASPLTKKILLLLKGNTYDI